MVWWLSAPPGSGRTLIDAEGYRFWGGQVPSEPDPVDIWNPPDENSQCDVSLPCGAGLINCDSIVTAVDGYGNAIETEAETAFRCGETEERRAGEHHGRSECQSGGTKDCREAAVPSADVCVVTYNCTWSSSLHECRYEQQSEAAYYAPEDCQTGTFPAPVPLPGLGPILAIGDN